MFILLKLKILSMDIQVQYSCVIGVKDPYKIQRVKAFCVLKPGIILMILSKNEIKEYCAKHITKICLS